MKTYPACLTIDFEERFCFNLSNGSGTWHQASTGRIKNEIDKLLTILDARKILATFFVTGETAEAHPGLIQMVAKGGHDIGLHSHSHALLYGLDDKAFHDDTSKGKSVLEDLTGSPVTAYRAPGWSISHKNKHFLDLLVSWGFTHDSSLFPGSTPVYGFPGAPTTPVRLHCPSGTLIEAPCTTFPMPGPLGRVALGGAWFRFLPSWWIRRQSRRALEEQGYLMAYIHPWELERNPVPSMVRGLSRLIFTHGTGKPFEKKLEMLLSAGSWMTLSELCQSWENLKEITLEQLGTPAPTGLLGTVQITLQ